MQRAGGRGGGRGVWRGECGGGAGGGGETAGGGGKREGGKEEEDGEGEGHLGYDHIWNQPSHERDHNAVRKTMRFRRSQNTHALKNKHSNKHINIHACLDVSFWDPASDNVCPLREELLQAFFSEGLFLGALRCRGCGGHEGLKAFHSGKRKKGGGVGEESQERLTIKL